VKFNQASSADLLEHLVQVEQAQLSPKMLLQRVRLARGENSIGLGMSPDIVALIAYGESRAGRRIWWQVGWGTMAWHDCHIFG
jgi:hypothetical protein